MRVQESIGSSLRVYADRFSTGSTDRSRKSHPQRNLNVNLVDAAIASAAKNPSMSVVQERIAVDIWLESTRSGLAEGRNHLN